MAANGPVAVAAILVAAGDGRRLGAPGPKAFCELAGRTMLEWAVLPFVRHPRISRVVVVVPGDHLGRAAALLPGHRLVPGGPTRQASVSAGLAELDDAIDVVLVHDVARPFVPSEVVDRVLVAVAAGADAVIPSRPVVDTVKRVSPDGAVLETVDREMLRVVQTPQGFRRTVLMAAHAAALGAGATDDAALVEAMGGRVRSVDGSDQAFKITFPHDLGVAEALARGLLAQTMLAPR